MATKFFFTRYTCFESNFCPPRFLNLINSPRLNCKDSPRTSSALALNYAYIYNMLTYVMLIFMCRYNWHCSVIHTYCMCNYTYFLSWASVSVLDIKKNFSHIDYIHICRYNIYTYIILNRYIYIYYMHTEIYAILLAAFLRQICLSY